MASPNKIKHMLVATLRKSPKVTPLILGKPGMGKSDMTWQIAKDLEIPEDRYMQIHVNNHDVVDFTGVPEIEDGMTHFRPTEMFYRFRKGTGPGMIVIEELPQSDTQKQTWAAGFILERSTPTFELDDEVRIICTGNRVEDKAGARPLLSHLNDRLYEIEAETSLDDWCEWAIDNNLDPLGIAFLRLRPGLLNDFDPTRRINPTQRSWTKLFTEVPTDLPTDEYFEMAKGKVGEGAASEWVAARDMMVKMPSVDSIRLQPENTEVPSEPAVKYAVATALSMSSDAKLFERDMKYVERMPKEFQMVYVTDVIRAKPAVQQSRVFIDWAIANKGIFMGDD